MLKRPEIALGFLVATIFWIGVLGWATSYSPNEEEKKACYQAAEKSGHSYEECKTFWQRTTSDPIATFTLVLAASTIGLWVATIGLYLAGERHSERELRAYISGPNKAEVINFHTTNPASLLTFKNSGKTPAHEVSVWASSAVAVFPLENPPAAPNKTVGEGASMGVIGPGDDFHARFASDIAVTPEERTEVIAGRCAFFVYGELTYTDSFGRARHTTFCRFLRANDARGSRGNMAIYHKWNKAT